MNNKVLENNQSSREKKLKKNFKQGQGQTQTRLGMRTIVRESIPITTVKDTSQKR